jgi:hypothetical protein
MKKLIVCFIFFLIPSLVFSHPGRLDRNGGHNGPNGYHYHNNSSGGSTNNSRSNTQPNESDEYKKAIILAILNSRDCVADVKDMDGDLLADLARYATVGPTTLIISDRTVFTFLVSTEFDRRDMTIERFQQYLNRENESLKESISKGGDTAVYKRQQTIIQLFISKL